LARRAGRRQVLLGWIKGGGWTSDKRLRRCGWAAAELDEEASKETRSVQAMYGALGGAKQTVPKAELQAATEVLKTHKDMDADMERVTDCTYVYKGAQG